MNEYCGMFTNSRFRGYTLSELPQVITAAHKQLGITTGNSVINTIRGLVAQLRRTKEIETEIECIVRNLVSQWESVGISYEVRGDEGVLFTPKKNYHNFASFEAHVAIVGEIVLSSDLPPLEIYMTAPLNSRR